ncbi:SAM-dependent MidA family methyltransferase [Pacificitalea manganoxidans]|nr:SAM-dependent MidA family methyltransferase [Pacificitalea manganoxidans]
MSAEVPLRTPPLARLIAERIALTGPMPLSDYMAECLLHPEHGYYSRGEAFGVAGDFTTAPEISQMFGELIGLALAQAWLDQGRPSPFVLAELGPGRGTLMADLLRATRAMPGFHAAARIVLVEASPALRETQARALTGYPVEWADSVADLPDLPLFLIANEFFDALPIRQFHRAPEGWAEVMVQRAETGLCFGLSAAAPRAPLMHRLADTAPGDIVEHCPALAPATTDLASRIAARGGVALIFDYGDAVSRGDTLQALRDHAPVHPLAHPGEDDLTAHVDFAEIARAAHAAGATASAMMGQGAWLERLGITARAKALAKRMDTDEALRSHIAAHRRLTHPAEMGSLFKTIAITPNGAPQAPGYDPA